MKLSYSSFPFIFIWINYEIIITLINHIKLSIKLLHLAFYFLPKLLNWWPSFPLWLKGSGFPNWFKALPMTTAVSLLPPLSHNKISSRVLPKKFAWNVIDVWNSSSASSHSYCVLIKISSLLSEGIIQKPPRVCSKICSPLKTLPAHWLSIFTLHW